MIYHHTFLKTTFLILMVVLHCITIICRHCQYTFYIVLPLYLFNVATLQGCLVQVDNHIWIPFVASSNPTSGALVVWPGMLFQNSRGNKAAAANLCLCMTMVFCGYFILLVEVRVLWTAWFWITRCWTPNSHLAILLSLSVDWTCPGRTLLYCNALYISFFQFFCEARKCDLEQTEFENST